MSKILFFLVLAVIVALLCVALIWIGSMASKPAAKKSGERSASVVGGADDGAVPLRITSGIADGCEADSSDGGDGGDGGH